MIRMRSKSARAASQARAEHEMEMLLLARRKRQAVKEVVRKWERQAIAEGAAKPQKTPGTGRDWNDPETYRP